MHITKLDREMIPYRIGDTVRFFNEHEELVTLVATKDTKYWTWPFEETQYVEEEQVVLESESGYYRLFVTVKGMPDDYRFFTFGMNSKEIEISGGKACYNPQGKLLSNPNNQIIVFDSMLIGNHIYYNVSVSDETPINGHMQSFYNKEYGVLQLMLDEKPVFKLDTVIFADKR